jgi:hypothetical protein
VAAVVLVDGDGNDLRARIEHAAIVPRPRSSVSEAQPRVPHQRFGCRSGNKKGCGCPQPLDVLVERRGIEKLHYLPICMGLSERF